MLTDWLPACDDAAAELDVELRCASCGKLKRTELVNKTYEEDDIPSASTHLTDRREEDAGEWEDNRTIMLRKVEKKEKTRKKGQIEMLIVSDDNDH